MAFSAWGGDSWLPVSSSPHPEPNWREIDHSYFIDLGANPGALKRLAASFYVEDATDVIASKSLACGQGYKKYLIRSFSADHSAIRVFETPDGLVVQTASLNAPPPAEGAIEICLNAPPGRIEGMFVQIWLPE